MTTTYCGIRFYENVVNNFTLYITRFALNCCEIRGWRKLEKSLYLVLTNYFDYNIFYIHLQSGF